MTLARYDYHVRTRPPASEPVKRKLIVPLNMPLKQFARTLARYTERYGAPELVWPVRGGSA